MAYIPFEALRQNLLSPHDQVVLAFLHFLEKLYQSLISRLLGIMERL
jgi:hypothetical protein